MQICESPPASFNCHPYLICLPCFLTPSFQGNGSMNLLLWYKLIPLFLSQHQEDCRLTNYRNTCYPDVLPQSDRLGTSEGKKWPVREPQASGSHRVREQKIRLRDTDITQPEKASIGVNRDTQRGQKTHQGGSIDAHHTLK